MENGFSFSEVTKFYFSPEQTRKLETTTVGIAGAGGIGSNCAVMLLRSGFTRFIIADFDRVTASNLNRQYYTADHIGTVKVDSLRSICRSINPAVSIQAVNRRIVRANIHDIFDSCDVLVEAFDDATSKALLFGEYLHSDKLMVGVSGIAGYGNSSSITIRNVRDNCYIVGDAVSAVSDTLKPHAPRVTLAAATMADIVLEWTLSLSRNG